ncbi:MAG: transglutaminase domain-containing protein [Chitinophagaceae bacterium]|nr:MAG: transglutaminase domain-containing protein [Chitinophagaceae bacterium]
MKSLPVVLFLLFYLDMQAQYVPDSATRNPEKFASYLQKKYKDPREQVRLLYSWITSNIRYDKDSALYFNWTADYETKITATLRRRKGVCENYASLFADIVNRLNIPAYVVHGFPSHANRDKDNSHSWVALKQNQEWYLYDPTWDAQSVSEKYYEVDPAVFIDKHIPFDPVWQLLEQPYQYQFVGNGRVNYKDSIDAFLQLDSLQKLLATERRLKNITQPNRMIKNWQHYNRMNVAIIAGEEDMKLYNAAVAAYNKAKQYFNSFIDFRNAGFYPQKTDEELKNILNDVNPFLKQAASQLDQLGKLGDNFQYDPQALRQQISALQQKTHEQLLFVHQYITTLPQERVKLFYK